MPWITLTGNEVLTRLAAPEVEAFSSAALEVGQADPLPEIISDVVDEVRGYVAACERNTLGPAGTIPPRLKASALAIIRFRLATRLPGMSNLIDDLRVKEYESAERLLKQVAACGYAVDDPTDTTETSVPANTPRITPRRRRFDSCSQQGI